MRRMFGILITALFAVAGFVVASGLGQLFGYPQFESIVELGIPANSHLAAGLSLTFLAEALRAL